MCFFKKRKAKKLALEQERLKKEQEAKVQQQPVVEHKEAVVVKPVKEEVVEPVQKVEPVKEQPTPKKESLKVVKEASKDDVSEDEIKGEKASKIPKYHVSQNKDEKSDNFKKWRVRKEGSTKTIKFFNTQKEAIEFAEGLAESAGSSVVIHKLDGSIRKQDYTKKE